MNSRIASTSAALALSATSLAGLGIASASSASADTRPPSYHHTQYEPTMAACTSYRAGTVSSLHSMWQRHSVFSWSAGMCSKVGNRYAFGVDYRRAAGPLWAGDKRSTNPTW